MEEPHLAFRKAVDKITKEIGGNMEAFYICVAVKKKNIPALPPDPEKGEEKIPVEALGGPAPDIFNLIVNAPANVADKYTQSSRGDTYIAVEVMKADILKFLLQKVRARNP